MTSSEVVLRAEHVSKKFCRDIRRSMWYGATDAVRSAVGMRSAESLRSSEFWAVRDVSLDLVRGKALGVIGKNGSGKSTLLSLLNGILRPDEGHIDYRGRIGALIALGAGFHPMLSGRENVFVNAAILGMSRRDVQRKFDEIVAFAGLEEFIDAPVKSYSSGMYARLGFSVAVHTHPDILLVDEVLSVGDAQFRARAMDRMWAMREEGVAVAFVSHSVHSVTGFCDEILLLDRGHALRGDAARLVSHYSGDDVDLRYALVPPELHSLFRRRESFADVASSGDVEILETALLDARGQPAAEFASTDRLRVRIRYRTRRDLPRLVGTVELFDSRCVTVWIERTDPYRVEASEIESTLDFEVDPLQLRTGRYAITVAFSDPSLEAVYSLDRGNWFDVVGDVNPSGNHGFFVPFARWRRSEAAANEKEATGCGASSTPIGVGRDS